MDQKWDSIAQHNQGSSENRFNNNKQGENGKRKSKKKMVEVLLFRKFGTMYETKPTTFQLSWTYLKRELGACVMCTV